MSEPTTNKPMSDEEYVNNKGVRCPVCGSQDIEGGSVDIIEGAAFQDVNCLNCNAEWRDEYHLIGYYRY